MLLTVVHIIYMGTNSSRLYPCRTTIQLYLHVQIGQLTQIHLL